MGYHVADAEGEEGTVVALTEYQGVVYLTVAYFAHGDMVTRRAENWRLLRNAVGQAPMGFKNGSKIPEPQWDDQGNIKAAPYPLAGGVVGFGNVIFGAPLQVPKIPAQPNFIEANPVKDKF